MALMIGQGHRSLAHTPGALQPRNRRAPPGVFLPPLVVLPYLVRCRVSSNSTRCCLPLVLGGAGGCTPGDSQGNIPSVWPIHRDDLAGLRSLWRLWGVLCLSARPDITGAIQTGPGAEMGCFRTASPPLLRVYRPVYLLPRRRNPADNVLTAPEKITDFGAGQSTDPHHFPVRHRRAPANQ